MQAATVSSKRTKIKIVGAGFSGLSLAWELRKKGFTVEIFEKSQRVGGLIQSIKTETHLRETAANGVLYNDRFARLASELGVEFVPTQKIAKKRFIFRDQKMRQWPLTFFESLGLIARALVMLCRYKLNGTLLSKNKSQGSAESLEAWAKKNLGSAFTRYVLSAGIRGIFAISPSKLSAQAILNSFKPVIKKAGKQSVKGTWAPIGGMGQLIAALHSKLMQSGQVLLINKEIKDLSDLAVDKNQVDGAAGVDQSHEDNCVVVLATPAWQAARLLSLPELAKLSSIPLLSVTCVWPDTVEVCQGFGCLVNEGDGFFAKGVLFNRSLFPGRGPRASETWIVGQESESESICDLTDDEIKARILQDRRRLMGGIKSDLGQQQHKPQPESQSDPQSNQSNQLSNQQSQQQSIEPIEFYVQRWPQAIPAYDHNLSEFVNMYETQNILPQNLFLTGNYLGKIGLAKIYDLNILLAEKISKSYP